MHLQVIFGRERARVCAVEGGTYVIGRGSDCDIVLPSDLVSRRHARIVVGATDVKVMDLGSSNGTFIDGARVLGEGRVAQGDVLLVGDVPLRLHGRVPPPGGLVDGRYRPQNGPRNAMLAVDLSGSLVEAPPATILRYLAVIKKTGVLVLTSPVHRGRIAFTRGHISEVLVDARKTRDPIQALTTILRWKGTFELDAPSEISSSLLLGLDAVLPAVGSASRPSMLPKPPRF